MIIKINRKENFFTIVFSYSLIVLKVFKFLKNWWSWSGWLKGGRGEGEKETQDRI